MHLPTHGTDRRVMASARGVPLPAVITLEVTVLRHAPSTGPGRPYRVIVSDGTLEITLVWFRTRGLKLDALHGHDRCLVSGGNRQYAPST